MEYMYAVLNLGNEDQDALEDVLNQYGLNGYRLVQIVGALVIFEKSKPDKSPQ